MQRLKDVGSYRISFGIECGNESYRNKVLLRKPKNKEIIDSFKIIAESGIAFSVNLIIGFPGETRDLIIETIDLVRQIKGYDTITVSIFTPYRGTVLREVAVKNNWLDPEHITIHTTSSSVLNMPPPYLSSADIDGLMRVIPLYVYFPKSEWSMIKRAEIDDAEGNKVLNYYSEIYKKNFLGDNQDSGKNYNYKDVTNIKTQEEESYKFDSQDSVNLTDFEVKMLTI
jgi:radical SAM superfamily enzyme YgiQ (UPF0313 family)